MPHDDVHLIDCTEAEHAAAILDILNDAIVNSTALYDYVPRPPAAMAAWFAAKRAGGFPVLGAVDAQGHLLAFASWGAFRAFPANKYTVEHSVYVQREQRGRGLGAMLLRALMARAQQAQLHVMVGCIDASNAGSIALHEKLGFTHSGTLRQVGFKFGRWLDAAFYQVLLPTPVEPRDG
ncbi:FR47-like protein [Bordetella holmesii CDC-H635-BH]|uniref:FR47-like protein n=2 Tax=Bordetella holmesii TaxID=35814 RepID=A0A158M6I3_9BORD|nr:FR47-like protein [Bordetella holmesii CDC-H572-BH]KAK91104.1 FR47-like protein [Bordetella holmesii CDC-H585-BH]KAL00108.1 FR47-like protein [Bordetella holmesii CDC-H635-BH]KCV02155.1 FR47-like protein [Bordetella holmesii CDC-H629-BH]KCV03126.1 FR47-like protein [Bordetella holmesii CDC-H719-BH]KCV10105.1 FR47-like protein [Bordetella holmesii CDC-H785-BH]KCV13638.1 FR47-like protein [Bordetella holmesii CDC-H643-BH]